MKSYLDDEKAVTDMKCIENKTFDGERALYGSRNLKVSKCAFDGPADGESALKECRNISAESCFFNLRYPFWHNSALKIKNSEMTELCRAALWYSDNIEIENTKLHGIKALRECSDIKLTDCDIISPEFGWSATNIVMNDCTAKSEYFLFRAENIMFNHVSFSGKYSFQYINRAIFEDCSLDTKDAFWHAKDVVVRDSVVKGEYLAWYSENVTFENCRIIGTQPFCYCKNLKLVNCEMVDTDLCFEKSDVQATIVTPVISIKNPYSGYIELPCSDEIIMDDENAKAVICERNKCKCCCA